MHILPIAYKNKIPIFMYHRVIDRVPDNDIIDLNLATTTERFEADISLLGKHYNFISIDELYESSEIKGPSCVITFDDGWLDNYQYAYPILQKHGIPATIYLTTSFIGSTSMMWFDKIRTILYGIALDRPTVSFINSILETNIDICRPDQLSPGMLSNIIISDFKKLHPEQLNMKIKLLEKEFRALNDDGASRQFLNWNEIEEMGMNGISFGSHCVNHSILTNLRTEDKYNEILSSKQTLISNKVKFSNSISYPNGNYDQETLDMSSKAGYKIFLSASYNKCGTGFSPRLLHRIGIAYLVSGNQSEIRFVILKAWLKRKMFDAHDIYNII